MSEEAAASMRRCLDLLTYDPETGVFRWRQTRGKGRAGFVAGSLRTDGYIAIMIDRKLYKAHRLAWLVTFGTWPANQLDHKNRIRTDNRISNLREATASQNSANTKTKSRFGLRGVRQIKGRGMWLASLRHKHLGSFETPQAAHAAYCAEARQAYGEFFSI